MKPDAGLLERLRGLAAGFARPLLAEPDANLAIVGLRALPGALEIWQIRRDANRWDRCEIPWETLLAGPLRRSLNAFYGVERGIPVYPLSSPPAVDVPEGHTFLHSDQVEDLRFVVTTSNQGYVDGELMIPFNTVQVFLLRG